MCPSGLDSFSRHANAASARRTSSGDRPKINYFSIEDGQVARVRFLEQGEGITWAQTHRIRNQWGTYKNIPCMDQMDEGKVCPACQSDNEDVRKRSTRGFVNLIWRGNDDEGLTRAPIYKRAENGALEKDANKQKIITGYEDSVWMWECSKSVLELLFEKDGVYKGLMSRDFLVKRKGSNKDNTKYSIEPAVIDGGPEPVSVEDAKLDQQKVDVKQVSSPDIEEMQFLLSAQNAPGGRETFSRDTSTQEEVFEKPVRSSAFSR